MLQKIYRVLNPVIYSMCDAIYLMPFYLVLITSLQVEMNPTYFIVYTFVLNGLVSAFIEWCNKKDLKLNTRKIVITSASILMVILFTLLMDSNNVFIIFTNFIFLVLNLSFLIKYHHEPADFAFQFKKRATRRLAIYLLFGFFHKIIEPEMTDFFSFALGYYIVYLATSLVLIGQYKISQVYTQQVGLSNKDISPIMKKYQVRKNLIIDPKKSMFINFALLILTSLGILGTVIYGINIFYSPFHFVLLKTTNLIHSLITKLIYYPITWLYKVISKWLAYALSKMPTGEAVDVEEVLEGAFDVINVEPGEPAKFVELISTLANVLIYMGLVFLLIYLIYRGINKLNAKIASDEKEFVYSMKEGMDDLKGIMKRLFRRDAYGNQQLHPVRKAYRNTLILLRDKGLKIKQGDTPNSILSKSQGSLNTVVDDSEIAVLASLTQQYNQVRYGEKNDYTPQQLERIEKELKEIKKRITKNK